MGLLGSMMGNATGADIEKVTSQIEPFLLNDEKIESAYKIFRDIIFTETRMITVDVQGITGKKKIGLWFEYHQTITKSNRITVTKNYLK